MDMFPLLEPTTSSFAILLLFYRQLHCWLMALNPLVVELSDGDAGLSVRSAGRRGGVVPSHEGTGHRRKRPDQRAVPPSVPPARQHRRNLQGLIRQGKRKGRTLPAQVLVRPVRLTE